MAILYQATASNPTSPSFTLFGDGVASSIGIDLTLAPLSFDLKGNPPAAALTTTGQVTVNGSTDSSFTEMFTLAGSKLTISFNKPLPQFVQGNNTFASFTIGLGYSGS